MWVADMDFQAPPEVIAALKERAEHGVFGYGSYGGWFEALAKWMGKRFGMGAPIRMDNHQPRVVAGLFMLVRAFD